MTLLKLLVFLNLILVIFNFVFIIRNFFTNYKGSRKLYKNVLFIVLLVISILIGSSCVLKGKWGIDVIKALEDPDGFKLSEEKLIMYKNNLGIISNTLPRNTIIAYVSSALAYLLFLNIHKERKKELMETGGWDYGKIKKRQKF